MRPIILILLILLTFSCSEKSERTVSNSDITNTIKDSNTISSDTIINSKEITNEIPGANYRKRAKGYFLIVKNDSSDFMPIFIEAKEEGKVSLELRFLENKSYREQFEELKRNLTAASKDFILDSLQSISLGRLITTGDLAIEISTQMKGDKNLIKNSPDYKKVSEFLLRSRLSEDFNRLLKPYRLSVSGISVEKVFLTDSKDLYNKSKIETDPAQIPDKILDCQVWIRLKEL